MTEASLILRGRILTMDESRPVAKALAIGDGRVLAAGTEAQASRWRRRGTRVWDLKDGQVAVPGFVDSHTHLATDAWRHTWIPLGDCKSLEETLDRLREHAARTKGDAWIVGRGWDESVWPERRYLMRSDLDRVSKRRPVLVNRVDGHLCAVNSAVLRLVRFKRGEPGIERGPTGKPTGILTEEAAKQAREMIPCPSPAAYAHLLEGLVARANALGITCVHDVVGTIQARAYQFLRRHRRLRIRAYLMPYDRLLDPLLLAGLHTGFGDEWLRLGAIKVFADGSLGAHTAALHEPYVDERRVRGGLVHEPKELAAILKAAHVGGFQLAVHAIGDRGIDVVLDAFEHVLEREQRHDHRHRIEHYELPSREAIRRTKAYDLVPVMQPNFVALWSARDEMYEHRLGKKRLLGNNPFRSLLDRGLPVAFGSDGMPYGPLYGIRGAVEAPFEGQRITAKEALRCYTANGAYASFGEGRIGVLAPGACGDFVVLSGDPTERGASLRTVAVEATVVGGQVVYDGSRRPRRTL